MNYFPPVFLKLVFQVWIWIRIQIQKFFTLVFFLRQLGDKVFLLEDAMVELTNIVLQVVEKRGFHASWTTSTDGQKCEGELNALPQPQVQIAHRFSHR